MALELFRYRRAPSSQCHFPRAGTSLLDPSSSSTTYLSKCASAESRSSPAVTVAVPMAQAWPGAKYGTQSRNGVRLRASRRSSSSSEMVEDPLGVGWLGGRYADLARRGPPAGSAHDVLPRRPVKVRVLGAQAPDQRPELVRPGWDLRIRERYGLRDAIAHPFGAMFSASTPRKGPSGSTATTSRPAASSAWDSFPVPAGRSSTGAPAATPSSAASAPTTARGYSGLPRRERAGRILCQRANRQGLYPRGRLTHAGSERKRRESRTSVPRPAPGRSSRPEPGSRACRRPAPSAWLPPRRRRP